MLLMLTDVYSAGRICIQHNDHEEPESMRPRYVVYFFEFFVRDSIYFNTTNAVKFMFNIWITWLTVALVMYLIWEHLWSPWNLIFSLISLTFLMRLSLSFSFLSSLLFLGFDCTHSWLPWWIWQRFLRVFFLWMLWSLPYLSLLQLAPQYHCLVFHYIFDVIQRFTIELYI